MFEQNTNEDISLITDRVRSTTRRLCFDTCLSVCPDQWGVPQQGPGRGGTLPGDYPAWGVPHLRYPRQTWPGGVPLPGGTPLG